MPELVCSTYGSPSTSSMEDVVELSLLLPAELAAELEAIAFERGATAGELVRRLVRGFLAAQKADEPGVPWMFRNHLGSGNSR